MSEAEEFIMKAIQAIADEAYDFAEEMLFKALALNTRDCGIYLSLMGICHRTGRWQEAVSWAELGLCRFDMSQPNQLPVLLVFNELKSFYFLNLGDFENAVKAADTALVAAGNSDIADLGCLRDVVSFARASMCKSIALMSQHIDAVESWDSVVGIDTIDTAKHRFLYWNDVAEKKTIFKYRCRLHFLELCGIKFIPSVLSDSIRWALNCSDYPDYCDIVEQLKVAIKKEVGQ